MKKIVELLKRYETILITVNAPKSDLEALRKLIGSLELSSVKLPCGFSESSTKGEYPGKRINRKTISFKSKANFEKISEIYKKLKDGQLIIDSDAEIIKVFENKHPHIREFLLVDMVGLYDKVSKVGDRSWSMEELRLILFFHFNIKPNQSTPKFDLLNTLKTNIYNSDYMDSMKKKYEGTS